MNLSSSFSNNFTQYNLKIPLDNSQWGVKNREKIDKSLFRPIIESIDLPLLPALSQQLQTIKKANSNLVVLRTLFSKKEYRVLRNKITQFQLEFSSHITIKRMSGALKSELYSFYQNPTLVYLLACKSKYLPPHSRYYYVPSEHELVEAWLNAQESLWNQNIPYQSSFLDNENWNGYVLSEKKLNQFIQSASKRPKTKDPISIHNWFVMYTISMFCWNLGHRASRDPFCDNKLMDIESKIVLINDKKKHGSNNFRVLKIPDLLITQYKNYITHLNNFALCSFEIKNPEHQSKEHFNYIKRLIAQKNKPIQQTRLFFLLREDGKKIVPITPKRIEEFFKKHGMPVKANFGRHHIATQLAHQFDLSNRTIQLFLGHSMREKTSLLSELNIMSSLDEITQGTNEIVINDGWKALRGIGKPRNDIDLEQELETVGTVSDEFFPKKNPGYIQRKEYQAEQTTKINLLTDEIKSYIDNLEKVKEIKIINNKPVKIKYSKQEIDEIEKGFHEKIIGLDYPHHVAWKELLKHLREEFYDDIPFPKLLNRKSLNTGVSSLNQSTVQGFVESQKNCLKWTYWLNNSFKEWVLQSDSEKEIHTKLTAVLVLNASIVGGMQREDTLLAIANFKNKNKSHNYKTFKTDKGLCIEIYEHRTYRYHDKETKTIEEFEETLWRDRWSPDPLSSSIIISLSTQPLPVYSEVEYFLNELLDNVGLPYNKQGSLTKSIAKAHRSKSFLNKRLHQHSVQVNKIHRRPLSISAWARLHTNQQWIRPVQAKLSTEIPQVKTTQDCTESFSPKQLKKVIAKAMKDLIKTRHIYRSVQCQRFSDTFLKIQNDLISPPLAVSLFFSWAILLSERGTKGFSKRGMLKLKDNTIDQYVKRLYNAFFIKQSPPIFETMSSEQITDFYRKVIEGNSDLSTTHNLKQLIYMFHTSAESSGLVERCDWNALDGIPIKYTPLNNGNFITSNEYSLLLSALIGQIQVENHLEIMSTLFIAILIYRFGLRPVEASKLMPKDLVFGANDELSSVVIRKNKINDNKSKNATRYVLSNYSLTLIEKTIIQSCYERARAFSEMNKNFCITSRHPTNETPYQIFKWMQQSCKLISGELKSITGDPQVTAYTLRHSYATNQAANICGKDYGVGIKPYEKINTETLDEYGKFSDSFQSLAVAMGHHSKSVTQRTYIHCLEYFDLYNKEATNKVNDEVFAFALTKKIDAFLAQKRTYGSRENVVTNYIQKSSIPTYEKLTTKHKKYKQFGLEDIYIEKPSIFQIFDFLVITMRAKNISEKSIYSQSGFKNTYEAINRVEESTSIKNLKSHFSKAKLPHLLEVNSWIKDNKQQLENFVHYTKDRKKLLKQLLLYFNCIEENSGKLVVVNENEVTSINSLLHKTNVQFEIEERVSSRKATCENRKVNYYNHSVNQFHIDKARRDNGYEIQLKLNSSFESNRALNLGLLVVLLKIIPLD